MFKKLKIYYCLIFFLLLQPSLHAWWSAGHKVSAKIAYLNLTDETRQKIDVLMPEFIKDATWADDQKEQGFHVFDTWHFTNVPYDPQSILDSSELDLISAKNEKNDVVWFINEAMKCLSQYEPSDATKSWVLRFLVHAVADIHQPLHCCTRYTPELSNGDRGGNSFKVSGMKQENLHQFWDSGLGLFSKYESDENIDQYAVFLMNRYPKESFSHLLVSDPKKWSEESQKIAVDFAYQLPESSQPTDEYINTGQELACKRIALSGYRLANILNTIFESKPLK